MLTRRPILRSGRGEEGVVGYNLAIVLAFALYAVIQLTRTTLAAQQIDTRVKHITQEVTPIDASLNAVPKLDETNRIAADINTAARPLTGEAQQIIDTAKSIDGTVDGINANANTINGTVHSIGGTVGSIQSTVHSIGGTVSALAPVVNDIRAQVAAINGRVDVIIGLAQAIKSDLDNVLAQVGGPGGGGLGGGGNKNIDGHANSIDCKTGGGSCQR